MGHDPRYRAVQSLGFLVNFLQHLFRKVEALLGHFVGHGSNYTSEVSKSLPRISGVKAFYQFVGSSPRGISPRHCYVWNQDDKHLSPTGWQSDAYKKERTGHAAA